LPEIWAAKPLALAGASPPLEAKRHPVTLCAHLEVLAKLTP